MAVRRKPAPRSTDPIKKKDETEVRKEEITNTNKEINLEKSEYKEGKSMQEHEKINNDNIEVKNEEDEEINEIQIKEEVVKSTGKPSKTRFLSSTIVNSEESEHNEEEVMRDSENLEKKNLEDEIEEEQENKIYDLNDFQPALSKVTNRSELKAGVISVVNSNCGKRVTLSKELMDKLNTPSKISMSFSDEVIAIGETIRNNNNQLIIKVSGTKGIIYSAGIVSEITERYGLDFSNRTSITFSEVEYIEVDGNTVAMISVDKDN